MLDFVASTKEKMINVRLAPTVLEQFKIACGLRGVSMSSLLHQFIVRTIREERELEPKAFEVTLESKHSSVKGRSLPTQTTESLRNATKVAKQNKG